MVSLGTFKSFTALFLFSQFCMINAHYGDERVAANLRVRGLTVVKIWCLILIFCVTFCCALIPLIFRSKENCLVLGNAFAGGVFLALSIHFVADAAYVTNDYTEGPSFIPFLLVLIGYILVLIVESFLFKIRDGNGETQAFLRVEQGLDGEESEVTGRSSRSPDLVRKAAVEVCVLLILGLSLHSAFEGITIGLAVYDRYAWRYLWIICIHRVVEALALGVVVLRMQPKRPVWTSIAYSFMFAISSPVGIIVALIIKESAQNGAGDWVYAITQSTACGVFLHVSIYHLLAKGFSPKDHSSSTTPFRRFFALFLGIVVVVVGIILN